LLSLSRSASQIAHLLAWNQTSRVADAPCVRAAPYNNRAAARPPVAPFRGAGMRFSLLSALHVAVLVSLLLLAPAPADTPAGDNDALKTAAALYDGIRSEVLPNGLKIYLKPIKGAPVVTTMVAYKVGSADEDLDSTGLSHYLEHLMFKGTEK